MMEASRSPSRGPERHGEHLKATLGGGKNPSDGGRALWAGATLWAQRTGPFGPDPKGPALWTIQQIILKEIYAVQKLS